MRQHIKDNNYIDILFEHTWKTGVSVYVRLCVTLVGGE
jgi:hypothetical protein